MSWSTIGAKQDARYKRKRLAAEYFILFHAKPSTRLGLTYWVLATSTSTSLSMAGMAGCPASSSSSQVQVHECQTIQPSPQTKDNELL